MRDDYLSECYSDVERIFRRKKYREVDSLLTGESNDTYKKTSLRGNAEETKARKKKSKKSGFEKAAKGLLLTATTILVIGSIAYLVDCGYSFLTKKQHFHNSYSQISNASNSSQSRSYKGLTQLDAVGEADDSADANSALNIDEKTTEILSKRYQNYSEVGGGQNASLSDIGSIDELTRHIKSKMASEDLEFLLNNYHNINMSEEQYNLIKGFAKEFDIIKLAAIIETESSWDEKAVSEGGAVGLMQVIEGSAKEKEWAHITDPKMNIAAGIRIYRTKENSLKQYLPPKELEKTNPKEYKTALWENFKMINAAYNGGQSVVIEAMKMAVKNNGKAAWQQKWNELVPYIRDACEKFYWHPEDKAEEIINHVKRVVYNYNLYRTYFKLREIVNSYVNDWHANTQTHQIDCFGEDEIPYTEIICSLSAH